MGRIYFPFLFAWEPNRASNLAARALDRACHATPAAIAAQPKESGRQFVLHLHTHVHYKHIPFVVSRRPPPFVSVHQFLIFNERQAEVFCCSAYCRRTAHGNKARGVLPAAMNRAYHSELFSVHMQVPPHLYRQDQLNGTGNRWCWTRREPRAGRARAHINIRIFVAFPTMPAPNCYKVVAGSEQYLPTIYWKRSSSLSAMSHTHVPFFPPLLTLP